MKTTLVALFGMILSAAYSQQKIPAFGKIDVDDLHMTDCEFDKGAEALKLIDYSTLSFVRGEAGRSAFKTNYEMRVRIKILKEKGMSYANVEIPFYNNNNEEKIVNIEGVTYNLDDKGKVKISNVNKSSIYIKRINKRYSRLVIAFPEVKAGSVIEYKYKLERDTYSHIKEWYFQDKIPTRYSEYEVKIPLVLVYKPQPVIFDSLEFKEKIISEVITMNNDAVEFKVQKQNFIMRNLPGIEDEVFMASTKDYIQRISFQLAMIDHGDGHIDNIRSSWADVVKQLKVDEDFGLQLSKELTGTEEIIKQALQANNKEARLSFLFNSIRNKIAVTNTESIFTDGGLMKTWKTNSGNAADINLLLVALLNKADIKAFPILLSSRENGLVNLQYHSLDQFNIVMAYAQVDNKFFVLDACDRISHYALTPERIVNTQGLVIEGDNGRWVDVINNTHKYEVMVALKSTVDNNGIMSGEGTISSMNYARKQKMEKYTSGADGFKHAYFIKPNPALTISDITILNAENDSLPLMQKIQFTTPLNTSGEYSYFNTNLLSEFTSNPFIETQRKTDIDFGYQKNYIMYGQFTIPEGYIFETLPANVAISMPDRSIQYTRSINVKNNILNTRISVDFKKPFYLIDIYSSFHEFYKKLLNSLNEQVVLKKKN